LIERIVLASARHSGLVFASVLILSVLASYYTASFGRINSDLGSLIRPSGDLLWYTNNEHYKAQFPFFAQTALVVVSGSSARKVEGVATQLANEFKDDTHFHSVFAPGVSEFVLNRKHYFLEPAQLEEWVQGIEYAYGPALRIADEASVANFLFVVADHLRANRGLPLPSLLISGAEGIIAHEQAMALKLLPPLYDPTIATHYQLIVLQGVQDLAQQLPNEAIVNHLRATISNLDLPLDVQVRLSGEIPLAHEEIQAALNGVGLAGLISIVLLALILGFGIRSFRFVLAIFTMLACGIALTLALAVLVVGSFNTLSMIFVVMFFGLGVDFAVHFGLRVRESQQSGFGKDALILAAKDVGPALFLCMMTSSIAFLAFVPTDYVGLGELGLISAMGMTVAFLLSITLLPALLSRTDLHKGEPDRFSLQMLSLPPKPTLLIFSILMLCSAWLAKDLAFDYSVLAMRDVETEGMQTLLELQTAEITTDYSISVLVDGPEEANRTSSALVNLKEVKSVTNPVDLVPRNQELKYGLLQSVLTQFSTIEEVIPAEDADQQMNLSAAAYLEESIDFAQASDRETLVQLIGAVKTLEIETVKQLNQSLLVALDRQLGAMRTSLGSQPFTLADLPQDLSRRLISDSGEYLLTVQPVENLNDRDAMTRFIQSVAAVAPNYAGRSIEEWGAGELVVRAFKEAISVSFVGIFLLLTLYFRSVLLPVFVLLPVVISLLMTFALCELTGFRLKMANILVVPLIIGLGVDTGIHVVHRARKDVVDIYESSTARAVVISSLTTVGTFFSLIFSPHLGAASIGLLLTVAISLLVVVTFVLLPTLISLLPEQTAAKMR
jgi:hopanoid biosynthesis associated RND transporter like protein HpnN